MNALRIASPLLVLALVAACGGSSLSVGSDKSAETGGKGDDGGAADAGKPCANDAECDTGFQCGFPRADACTAKGTCFDVRGLATCAMFSPGCACDGTEINVACLPLPSGYVSKPLNHAGACGSGGETPCSTTSECVTGFECVFPKADGCSAKGVCKDARGLATCAAFSSGCACDGTEINVACQPFDGYVSKPLRHAGTCTDGG